jgi:hypothetical protein
MQSRSASVRERTRPGASLRDRLLFAPPYRVRGFVVDKTINGEPNTKRNQPIGRSTRLTPDIKGMGIFFCSFCFSLNKIVSDDIITVDVLANLSNERTYRR